MAVDEQGVVVVLGCFNNGDRNAADQSRKDRSFITGGVVAAIDPPIKCVAQFFQQHGFHGCCIGRREPVGIEIDPFFSVALRRGVSPMQPRHGVAVENLDADATEFNGSRTPKSLSEQLLPGLWF